VELVGVDVKLGIAPDVAGRIEVARSPVAAIVRSMERE
jgi:hypothetical protein